jgi:glycine dehydrogenase
MAQPDLLTVPDSFVRRHLGPTGPDIQEMLAILGMQSLDALVDGTIPADIRLRAPMSLPPNRSEQDVLSDLRSMAGRNQLYRSLIGMGYFDCVTPPVIQRNILENPGWYTQYTPYQAEIAQGRLEALINFQTMVADLTGLPLANASLLDEATAAAEAMAMCVASVRGQDAQKSEFFVSQDCHPQTIAVIQTRAEPLGITLRIGANKTINFTGGRLCGLLLQYPTTDGYVGDYSELVEQAHAASCLVVVATDLLAMALLRPPGEFGADIAVGSTQRFGVPLGYGGPHAAFLAAKEDYKRQMPGRIVGASRDNAGKTAYRLALQTREQHIRRERATSNICTAQVLLAVMAGMYAVYHGPEGLRRIALRVHALTKVLAQGLRRHGYDVSPEVFFDTLRVRAHRGQLQAILSRADALRISLRRYDDGSIGVSVDERSTLREVETLFESWCANSTWNIRLPSGGPPAISRMRSSILIIRNMRCCATFIGCKARICLWCIR